MFNVPFFLAASRNAIHDMDVVTGGGNNINRSNLFSDTNILSCSNPLKGPGLVQCIKIQSSSGTGDVHFSLSSCCCRPADPPPNSITAFNEDDDRQRARLKINLLSSVTLTDF